MKGRRNEGMKIREIRESKDRNRRILKKMEWRIIREK